MGPELSPICPFVQLLSPTQNIQQNAPIPVLGNKEEAITTWLVSSRPSGHLGYDPASRLSPHPPHSGGRLLRSL
ncbi:hypothetical protein TWF569_007433 [Orbilia oligospora]|uniref:Uncharacterized protein n=1 Tax=Orbilia oligospora TaxID=2813651 RepID=A0A7C8MZ18_ORBOL|nr:hypothetical protein TWF102_002213 [Orbilia oligospora]KAF3088455.1 hypothetical protein TWF103_001141 [Orbilia oligospora]KAF3092880.1 hypothetical protein TWF706_008873 [Orbilia oligospora]KAF3135637.1 hypothetical protein TWF594_008360 [Orbilia oligospora]KAF3143028.1 hypothetical protein TWF569_007433 [Orbilia oligospora]